MNLGGDWFLPELAEAGAENAPEAAPENRSATGKRNVEFKKRIPPIKEQTDDKTDFAKKSR